MSPVNYGPSDINNPRGTPFAGMVPESYWMTKALLFDFDWIIREAAFKNPVMPDHQDSATSALGLKETFQTLRSYEIRLALTSNQSQKVVVPALSNLGLANDFDCIRCAEELPAFKPSPELYINVLETLGIRPIKAIALETSQEGIDAAKGAELFCVTMEGCPKGDFVLPSFMGRKMIPLLEEMDKMKRQKYQKR